MWRPKSRTLPYGRPGGGPAAPSPFSPRRQAGPVEGLVRAVPLADVHPVELEAAVPPAPPDADDAPVEVADPAEPAHGAAALDPPDAAKRTSRRRSYSARRIGSRMLS